MTSDEALPSAETNTEAEVLADEGGRPRRNLRRYLASVPWTVIAAVASVIVFLVLIALLLPPNYWRF